MTIAPPPDAPQCGALGWTGKLPSNGDFVARRVPLAFREPWERWLAEVLAGSRERLRERWQDAFLSAPAWRFVLAPGVLAPDGWAGLLLPSVDAIGRCYPLTVVGALPAASLDPEASLRRAADWFAKLEALATGALDPSADLEAFDAALALQRFPADRLVAGPAAAPAQPVSAWFADDSEIFSRRLLLGAGLPDAERYCEMLAGAPAGGEPGSA